MKKIVNKFHLLCVFVVTLCVFANSAYSQTQPFTIKGKISEKKGAIEGASVVEIDADGRTVKGTTTDIDGNFSLKITNTKNKIAISYIGFKTQTLAINTRTVFNVTLPAGDDLDEVIVVADRKIDNGSGLPINEKNSTTTITKIDAKVVEDMSSASIDQALQGRLPGVDIVAASGDPGAGMSIRIRGTASISSNSNPLIVVDGLPYETEVPGDFNFGTADEQGYASLINIAPADIKDISILKDAGATAVWGSRAANGVIVINTKRGTIGPPTISYTFRGTMQVKPDHIPFLNGNQYSTLIPEEYTNARGQALNTQTFKEFQYDPSDPYWYKNYSNNTDWVAAISRVGYTQDHTISVTGGGERAKYYTSLAYFKQTGVTLGTDLSRLSTTINLDYTVSSKIRFKADIRYTQTDNNRNYVNGTSATADNLRNVAYRKMPNMSIYEYDEFGNLTPNFFSPASNIQGQYPGTYNPVAMALNAKNQILGQRVTPHFNLFYQIKKGILTLTADLQFDINNTKTKTFLPQIATGRPTTETSVNRSYDGDVDVFNVTSRTNLVYTPKFKNPVHNFVSSTQVFTSDTRSVIQQVNTSNSASSFFQDPSIPARTQNQDLGFSSGLAQSRSVSGLLQAQYTYNSKYTINATLRGDGNSKFGPNNRQALFPAVSGRYRVSGEKFMRRYDKWLNDFSIKASYGQIGNAPRYDYTFYNLYANYDYTYLGQSGVYSQNVELTNLRWETVISQNLGFTFAMFKNKLNIDIDIYKTRTKDLFYRGLQVPSYTGFSNVDMNAGVLDNQGWEFNMGLNIIKKQNFTLDFNFNISNNSNVLREISPFYPNKQGDVTKNGQYLRILQVNNPFGSFFGYKYKGVYSTKEETIARGSNGKQIIGPNGQLVYMQFNYPSAGYIFQPGDAKYEDINNDGSIDYRDVVYLGNSVPKLIGGFGTNMTYKANWKLSLFFSFRYDVDVINGTKMSTTNMYSFDNQSTAVLRRWKNPGDITDIPRALYNTGYNWLASDRYVEDASFVRLRAVTLSYGLNKKLLQKLKLKGLRTYVTAENIFTLTNYTGQDPEVSSTGADPFRVSIDNSLTPPTKTLSLGLSVTF